MFALLLSFLSLCICWAVAHLLAFPATYLVHSTSLTSMPVVRVFRPFVRNADVKSFRKFFFGTTLIGLVGVISLLLDSLPISQLLRGYVQNFIDFEVTQTLMRGLFSNLVLTSGLFVIYQVALFSSDFFPRVQARLREWRSTRFHVIKLKNMELFTPDQITDFLVSLTRYVQTVLSLILIFTALTYTLSFFPDTSGLALGLMQKVAAMFRAVGQAVMSFMPNLITLVVILLTTRFVLKLLNFFHEGIQNNRIRIFGLHKELAEPTYQLLRFFTITLAIVIAYPYVPGSDSPVFRGITIFAGFLLSLGSTALVTNIVSGIVLTYTRGLRIGDRVKIGAATTGDVVERTLLVTRIRTIKNVVISIPNSVVLNNEIVNYSAMTTRDGLILHTTVTIGYDVPWRRVNELLIQSALSTKYIELDPKPFVLQTSLDDYYVSYELNAYTVEPKKMALIYSELHQNIQDHFNTADVEIMSPAYTAFRKGDQSTIAELDHKLRPELN